MKTNIFNRRAAKGKLTMITERILTSDGIWREIDAKVFGTELRIYKVRGNVSDREALAELGQIACLEHNCDRVKFSNV